jgi:hypothetical protein
MNADERNGTALFPEDCTCAANVNGPEAVPVGAIGTVSREDRLRLSFVVWVALQVKQLTRMDPVDTTARVALSDTNLSGRTCFFSIKRFLSPHFY